MQKRRRWRLIELKRCLVIKPSPVLEVLAKTSWILAVEVHLEVQEENINFDQAQSQSQVVERNLGLLVGIRRYIRSLLLV